MTNDRRPRLDAIIRSISEGKYDEELSEILGAIQKRNNDRKEKVMAMVNEVFGDDYKVVPQGHKMSNPEKAHIEVTKHRSPKWKPALDAMVEGDPDDVIAAEKPPEGGLTGEFESRSPQFGAIEDKGEENES